MTDRFAVTPRPTTDNPSRDEVSSWPCACGHDKTRHLKNGLQCLVGVCRCMHWTAPAPPPPRLSHSVVRRIEAILAAHPGTDTRDGSET